MISITSLLTSTGFKPHLSDPCCIIGSLNGAVMTNLSLIITNHWTWTCVMVDYLQDYWMFFLTKRLQENSILFFFPLEHLAIFSSKFVIIYHMKCLSRKCRISAIYLIRFVCFPTSSTCFYRMIHPCDVSIISTSSYSTQIRLMAESQRN